MVSTEATPVNAPPVVTFNPPLDVKAKVPVEFPIAVLLVPLVLIFVVPVTVNPESVPTLVSEEAVTPEFSVVPVNVPAAAVTVISAVPLKETPLIFLAFCNIVALNALDAVAAFPEILIEYVPTLIFEEKSPAVKLVAVSPEIAVFVTAVTRPCTSVVNTGMFSAEPYVFAVPTFGNDNVVVPPSDTDPPPDRPVPAVTVKEELASTVFAIDAEGSEIVPEEIVKPFDPVKSPAEVIVPEPVVEIFPVVEIVILAARSFPVTEVKVGKPEAFPWSIVVVVPANVPKTPPDVFVTTPLVVKPVSAMLEPEREVKVPDAEAVPPIAPGDAKVAPPKEDALIVPVPVKFKDAPVPTSIAAAVLVPLVNDEKAADDAVTFVHCQFDVPLFQAKT